MIQLVVNFHLASYYKENESVIIQAETPVLVASLNDRLLADSPDREKLGLD